MRILCCGDRDWDDVNLILETLLDYVKIENIVIIHGACRGADFLVGEVAKELGFKVEEYPADWTRFGPSAGPRRNVEMLNTKPDHVIAFHNNIASSRGTGHMISITEAAEVSYEVKASKK